MKIPYDWGPFCVFGKHINKIYLRKRHGKTKIPFCNSVILDLHYFVTVIEVRNIFDILTLTLLSILASRLKLFDVIVKTIFFQRNPIPTAVMVFSYWKLTRKETYVILDLNMIWTIKYFNDYINRSISSFIKWLIHTACKQNHEIRQLTFYEIGSNL